MNGNFKLWIEHKGEKAFGYGPLILLKKVHETGSLKKASEDLDMSYNKAWTLIKKLEKVNGFSFLERQVGGTGGGKSILTDEVKELMVKYEGFHEKTKNLIEETYNDFF